MSHRYRITEEQIRFFEKPRPTLAELMGAVNLKPQPVSPRPVKPLEVVGYFAAATTISGLGLLALPFVLTVVGVLLPIAAIGLLVRHVVRLHWRRRP
jgi:hypothetical protein